MERIAATPREIKGQRGPDFGFESGRLSDEIQAAFSEAHKYWDAFKSRRDRGKGSLTTITRETWILPLLELLDFELTYQPAAVRVAGNSYPISHRGGEDLNAPPIHIVSWEQRLDRRGEARQSPHGMVQDYLNRTDPLWGIVTNGRHLRLLRDTARLAKPTYVEFDLESMFEGNLYSEFVLLYRLVHRSRLPRGADDAQDCLLETYYQQGIDEGGRVPCAKRRVHGSATRRPAISGPRPSSRH
jgi:hypothetical protein